MFWGRDRDSVTSPSEEKDKEGGVGHISGLNTYSVDAL